MTDKTIFREVFNFFTRFAQGPDPGGEAAYWLEVTAALDDLGARLSGSALACDLTCAVFLELERRAQEKAAG